MLSPGARLGPYEVLGLLATGGMGEVYRARDPRLGREVAIKVLPERVSGDPERLRRFEQEARAAGALDHPNVLAIHDVGVRDGAPYVVSELVEGETLRARLRAGALALRDAIGFAAQIARGLAAAHEKGIVHRDLKPENLLVTKDRRVKILDFGLAKLSRPERLLQGTGEAVAKELTTASGTILGTVGYMSPEQVRGQAVDHRSDVFSLGAVLFEMLSGRRAFRGETPADTLTAILRQDPPELSGMGREIPPAVERITRRCLEKDPAERFQSARDIGFALEDLSETSSAASAAGARRAGTRRRRRLLAVAGLVVAGALGWSYVRVLQHRAAPPPSFRQLTFKRGVVQSARFAPDGHTIVYGAGWEGSPSHLYSVRLEGPESSSLDLPEGNIASISPSGELAIVTGRMYAGRPPGTLARVPLAGGAPRELAKRVFGADWSPDGRRLAVVRFEGRKTRLEFPIGRVIYESASSAALEPRVSPKGDQVAFLEERPDGVSLELVDLTGRKTTLMRGQQPGPGIAWSRSGDEVWFTEWGALWAFSLTGRRRLVARFPGAVTLNDISRDGRVVLTLAQWHASLMALAPGETEERDLSWFDASSPAALSSDGQTLLFTDRGGTGSHPDPRIGVQDPGNAATYLRRTDGSPAVRLGEGRALALSPNGKWALSLIHGSPPRLVLLPTGAGEPRPVPLGDIECWYADLLPDGQRVLLWGSAPGQGARVFVQDLDGRGRRALTPEGFHLFWYGDTVSPDGKQVAAADPEETLVLFPIEGGEPRAVPGIEAREAPVGWSEDQRFLYVFGFESAMPGKIHRIDLANGRRELWKEIRPRDPAAFGGFGNLVLTPDRRSYAYSLDRYFCTLYLVDGLR